MLDKRSAIVSSKSQRKEIKRMTKQFRPRGIEKDGLKYYQEQDKHGDYVSVDPSTAEYYCRIGQPGKLEARVTAIAGDETSVCTSSVSVQWLWMHCHRVSKANIPAKWIDVL
jgi:hypothetical protein